MLNKYQENHMILIIAYNGNLIYKRFIILLFNWIILMMELFIIMPIYNEEKKKFVFFFGSIMKDIGQWEGK